MIEYIGVNDMRKGIKFYCLLALGLIVAGGVIFAVGAKNGGSLDKAINVSIGFKKTASTTEPIVIDPIVIDPIVIGDEATDESEGKRMGLFDWFKAEKSVVGGTVVEGSMTLDAFDELSVDNTSIDFVMQTGSEWRLDYCVPEGKEPVVKQNGGSLSIMEPENISMNVSLSGKTIQYRVTVPEGTELDTEIMTSSGDISIKADGADGRKLENRVGLELKGKISSTSGEIKLEGIGASGEVLSSSGDVAISRAAGDKLDVSTTSGEITLTEAKYDRVSAESSSGDVEVADLTVAELKTGTTSGRFNAEGIEAKEFSHSSSSGSVKMNKVAAEKIGVGTTSGSITLSDCEAETMKAEASSGSIRLELDRVEHVECGSTSGSVTLTLPGSEDDYSYDIKCTSGTITIDDAKYGNKVQRDGGDKKVKVNTSSGSVKIEF